MALHALQFSPNGHLLAAADANRHVYVWEVMTDRLLLTLQGHTDQVMSLAWSPDSQQLATASGIDALAQPFGSESVVGDHTIRIWNVAAGATIRTIQAHRGAIEGLIWTPDGSTIISGSLDRSIVFWPST
jgi:WD40 repeat protein